MGGFIILRRNGFADSDAAVRGALDCGERMGFPKPAVWDHGGYFFCVYPKVAAPHVTAVRRYENGDFAFACGTLIYDGRLGADALDALYAAYDPGFGPPSDCHGHFALVIARGGSVFVRGDTFGGYQIQYDMRQRALSSSFLLLAAALPTVSFSAQGIFEYVFNGVVSGDETLLREILRLPIGAGLGLGEAGFTLHRRVEKPPSSFDEAPLESHLDQVAAALSDLFASFAGVFRGGVTSALSGGYDSRLLLALLRSHGIPTRLYVYGAREDRDVQLAERIAKGEGLPIDIIDKEAHRNRMSDLAETVEQNFWATDGYVWAGLFDNGAETAERRRRVEGGVVSLNGGGGEILRNFFYLRDGVYRPRALLWAFYSQYDPRICTRVFHTESYYRRLEQKLGELVGDETEYLPRPAVEWLYHRFRCRAWDGKVNTNNNRFGHALLPFEERRLTEMASRIPLRLKNHGAFEAMLIDRFDRRLARYPSSYGHSFEQPPPWTRTIADYGTLLRPASLRRFSFRVKRMLRKPADATGPLSPYVAAALPGSFDFVRRFFRLDRVGDPQQMSRILSLEYLARKLGAKLDPAVD